jgi:hypothetical protein
MPERHEQQKFPPFNDQPGFPATLARNTQRAIIFDSQTLR